MRMIILGPPGAGKGTQSARIAAAHAVPAISTGDIFRSNIKRGTELGRQVEQITASGAYVPDEITNAIVRDRLQQPDVAEAGFLLDGYPRTDDQVRALDELLAESGHALDVVLELVADVEEIVTRLLHRARVEGRADDTEDVIRTRLAVYTQETAPLSAVYAERGLLRQVDGMGSVDEVFARIENAITTARAQVLQGQRDGDADAGA